MGDFVILLRTAMASGVPTERAQAEQRLQGLCFSETSNFFTNLVKEFIQESHDVGLRQFAGALVKNSIRLVSPTTNDFLWNTLDDGLRENIKMTLLSTMVCKVPMIQKACANAISTIFTVEIQQDRWNNLIADLTASAQTNVDVDIRKAAILTLGQICDKLKEYKLGQRLAEKMKENVLMAILIGLAPEERDSEIKENSIIALGDCVEFMTEILAREQVRDYATGLVLGVLQDPNEKVKIAALQRSCDYVKAIYLDFGKYVASFLQATQDSILNDDEEISTPAMEIWTTLANEFHERREKNAQVNRVDQQTQQDNPNHLIQIYEPFIKVVLQNLLKNNLTDSDEEAESSIQDAAQKALSSVVESVGDLVVPTFTAFISNTLNNSNWNFRQAAILAFGALMEGISENTILNLISSIFSEYVKTLLDQSKKVKESAAKLLSKIAEFHPETILLRQNVGPDLQIIVNSLKDSPAVSRQICWFFCFLAENLDKYPQNSLQASLDPLIQALIENAARNDFTASDLNVINISFMAALNIIHFCRNPAIGQKYFKIFVTQFKVSYQIPIDRRGAIQTGILSALHSSMLTMDEKFDPNMADDVFQLVTEYFQFIQDVDNDGIYIISALASCIGPLFVNYLDKAWPFIEHALVNKRDDLELFKVCVGVVGDISRSCEIKFISKLDILQKFFDIVESPHFNRDAKLNIFSCIGDIFLSTKEFTEPYLNRFLGIIDKSFTASIELAASDNAETQDYAEQLKEKIIEAYTCALHGINDKKQNPTFVSNFPQLIQFVSITCDKNIHPTVDYVRSCLTLLIDIANFYKQQVVSHIKTQLTTSLIQTLQAYDHTEDGKETIAYAQKILSEI